jgi:hypothetical protein
MKAPSNNGMHPTANRCLLAHEWYGGIWPPGDRLLQRSRTLATWAKSQGGTRSTPAARHISKTWPKTMSNNRHKSTIISLVALALVVGFPLGSGLYQRSKLALASHVDTLAEFSAEMPKPEKVIVFEKDGSAYAEVIGLRPRFPAVPVASGPPAYIFDSNGQVRYWTTDVGDSIEYRKNWQNRHNAREVSMKGALEFVKAVKQ